MKFRLEIEQEEDGRWIAEVVDLPGVLAYGNTCEEAQTKVQALALALWRTVSNTEKPAPISSLSHLRLHERLVQYACQTCFSRASSHRLDHQATNRFSPHTFPVKKDFSLRARNDKRVRLVAFVLWRRYSDSASAS